MRKIFVMMVVVAAAVLAGLPARAHFQTLIPSTDVVEAGGTTNVTFDIRFMHPFEGQMMNMEKPAQFGVVLRGQKTNLLNTLKETKIQNFKAFTAGYQVKRPGDQVFYIEPAPYWEPTEDCYIVHYTKVVVGALGMEDGWDAEVGQKMEIVPLVRPYGLWTGNIFRGVVKKNGRLLAGAEIEVEYLNEGGRVRAPSAPFITQVVKADGNGVFEYAMPKAGWWGFAALSTDDRPMTGPDGKPKSVEIGGLMWVKVVDMR